MMMDTNKRLFDTWERHNGPVDMGPPLKRFVVYKPQAETRGFDLEDAIDQVEKDIERSNRRESFSNAEERTDTTQWKKWKVLEEYAEDAIDSRLHRGIFYAQVERVSRNDIERIIHHKESLFSNKDIGEPLLNIYAMDNVYNIIVKWYVDQYSALTGTSYGLSGASSMSGTAVSSSSNADDMVEEQISCDMEMMCFWIVYCRLHFIIHQDKWLSSKMKGRDFPSMFDRLRYGQEGGCLVDTETPVLDYNQRTLILACDSLYRAWQEIIFNNDVFNYFEHLKARYVMLSTVYFTDGTKTLNVPEMRDSLGTMRTSTKEGGEEHKVLIANRVFHEKILNSLGNVDRCIVAFERIVKTLGKLTPLVNSFYNTPLCYDNPKVIWSPENEEVVHLKLNGKETEKQDALINPETQGIMLAMAFRDWQIGFISGHRNQFILEKFRKQIILELVRPGEYNVYRKKYPLRDPNATNIVSGLRPNDMDRLRPELTAAPLDKIIKSETDHIGMIIGRNEVAIVCLEYFCGENQTARLEWSDIFIRRDAADLHSIKNAAGIPVILQTFCGYIVYCPWYKWFNVLDGDGRTPCRKAKNYGFLYFHEAFHFWCIQVITHYKDITAAIIAKHRLSSTRTPKVIATQVTAYYEVAYRALIKVYGGACVEDTELRQLLFESQEETMEDFCALPFSMLERSDDDKGVERPIKYQRKRRQYYKEMEARRKAHYEMMRKTSIPVVFEEKDLFPEIFASIEKLEEEEENTNVDSSFVDSEEEEEDGRSTNSEHSGDYDSSSGSGDDSDGESCISDDIDT